MTARVYLYPRTGVSVEKVDLSGSASLTDLQRDPTKVAGYARTYGGSLVSTVSGGYDRVRVVVERASEREDSVSAFRDKAHAIIDHLQRGGRIGFALDSAKACVHRVTSAVIPGSTSLNVTQSAAKTWESSAALAVNDRVVVSSALPLRMREEGTVASVPGSYPGAVTLDRAVWFRHTGAPVILRHYGFFPALRLDPDAAGEPLIVSERGYVFTLSLPLIEEVDAVAEIVQSTGFVLKESGTLFGDFVAGQQSPRVSRSADSIFGDL